MGRIPKKPACSPCCAVALDEAASVSLGCIYSMLLVMAERPTDPARSQHEILAPSDHTALAPAVGGPRESGLRSSRRSEMIHLDRLLISGSKAGGRQTDGQARHPLPLRSTVPTGANVPYKIYQLILERLDLFHIRAASPPDVDFHRQRPGAHSPVPPLDVHPPLDGSDHRIHGKPHTNSSWMQPDLTGL